MINFKKHFMLLVAVLATTAFAACSDNDKDEDVMTVTAVKLSADNLTFVKEGGVQTLSVQAPVQATATTTADWLGIEVGEQSRAMKVTPIKISASANTSNNDRTATITVSVGSETHEVSVTQLCEDGLILGTDTYHIGREGGSLSIQLTANGNVTATPSAGWIKTKDATTRGVMQEQVRTFVIESNPGPERSATITFVLGTLTASVTVVQEGQAGTITRTAMEIARDMYPGWNLGNTMEATGGETSWQHTKTTQAIINCVKEAGFNSIRIPCSWDIHSDSNGKIDAAWMARVREIVDYCINANLYVVLNDHWDNGWVEVDGFTDLSEANVSAKEARMRDIWTQIASEFRDYGEHLLFAGLNEPNSDTQAKTDALIRYEQAFINAVRATGGANANRILVVQGPNTDINRSIDYYDVTRLTDSAKDALMVEVHYYDPGQFCGTWDSTGDKAFYYWGKENYADHHNANWGDESYMAAQFAKMKDKYVSKGYPVIMGEYAGQQRTMPEGEDQAKHDASVKLYYKCVNEYAVNNGIVAFAWDTNSTHDLQTEAGTGTIIDRANCKIVGTNAMEGIKEGLAAAKWPY